MVARGLGRSGLLLIRTLGVLGAVAGGVVSLLDPQGTGQLMCAARGLYGDADFAGSLALLAGAPGVAPVGALVLLGATSSEVEGCVNELAGTKGWALGEAMRLWAVSGNF